MSLPWAFLGIALAIPPIAQWLTPRGLDVAAGIALITETSLMSVVTIVAIGLISSLGRNRLVER
jgi:hypothetical protein